MDIDDYTSKGYVRRWDIVGGEPRCLLNALAPDIDHVADALARNAAIRSLVERAHFVELAYLVTPPTNGEPETIYVEDTEDEGVITLQEVPNPAFGPAPREIDGQPNLAWNDYDAAADIIANADLDVLLYLRVKNAPEADDVIALKELLDAAGPIDYSELEGPDEHAPN